MGYVIRYSAFSFSHRFNISRKFYKLGVSGLATAFCLLAGLTARSQNSIYGAIKQMNRSSSGWLKHCPGLIASGNMRRLVGASRNVHTARQLKKSEFGLDLSRWQCNNPRLVAVLMDQ